MLGIFLEVVGPAATRFALKMARIVLVRGLLSDFGLHDRQSTRFAARSSSTEGFMTTTTKQSLAMREVNQNLQRLWSKQALGTPASILQFRQTADITLENPQPPTTSSFHLVAPVCTLADTTTPEFVWTACPGASSYVVNIVIDSRSSQKVADSGVLSATTEDVSQRRWQLPSNRALVPGQRYRWWVTAIVGKEELESPALGEPEARFAILTESDSQHLSMLKRDTGSNQLANALLDVQAGLLDRAVQSVEVLRDAPHQNPTAKEFLSQVISKIESLKNNR